MGGAWPYLNLSSIAAKIHLPFIVTSTRQPLPDSEKGFSNLGNPAEYCVAFAANAPQGAYARKAPAGHACCSDAYPLDTSPEPEEVA